MTEAFQPFSRRLVDATEEEALFEGVPEHLQAPISNWVFRSIGNVTWLAQRVAMRLRLPKQSITYLAEREGFELLDVADAMLRFCDEPVWAISCGDQLEFMLHEGGSAYRVKQDHSGLERRVDVATTMAYSTARQTAEGAGKADAARYLQKAWAHAYGLHPDPEAAYADAIRAVEAVASPFFLPNDSLPTLGKVVGYLKDNSHRFQSRIINVDGSPAGISAWVETARLLWRGHSERHAGTPNGAPITALQAEDSVQAAIVLVQWLASGAVERVP